MGDTVHWVIRTQCGDLDAYGELVSRYQDMAFGYAYSLLGDFHLAEDAAQEAFIQGFRHITELRDPRAFSGWLKRIVFTCSTRLLRSKPTGFVDIDALCDVAADQPSPDDVASLHELQHTVHQAIQCLSRDERIVTTLFYIGGYSHRDIADFLEIPVSTVKSRLYTSRKRLKERMVHLMSDMLHDNKPTASFTRKVLDNIPVLRWDSGKNCTFAGALESALSVTPYPYDYTTLMGVSGLAFRTRWWQAHTGKDWCGSSPVGEFPEEIDAIRRATGWQLRVEREFFCQKTQESLERLIPDVIASINSGLPVLAYGVDHLDMTVITGYEDEGRTVVLQDYYRPDVSVHTPIAKLPWFLIFPDKHTEPLAIEETVDASLKIARSNWDRSPVADNSGTYAYGRHALYAWAGDLQQSEAFTDEQRSKLFSVSGWNMGSLLDARQAGVQYLRRQADILPAPARQALLDTADQYAEEVQLLQQAMATDRAFLGPCQGRTIAEWTPGIKQTECEILLHICELEASAIQQLESIA